MKYIITIFVLLLFVNAVRIREEDDGRKKKEDNELADRIRMSFRSGNSKMLSMCLNQDIELVIDSEKIDYQHIGSQQAEILLKSFFQKNPPISFQYVYQGSSNSDVRYSVGNYKSRNKDFLIYILTKKTANGKYMVNTIQFREG
jgi:hypothetical protein